MKKENLFYIFFLFTILLVRLAILLIPDVDIIIMGKIIHHFWIGILILAISFVLRREWKIAFFGIGLGLILDQLVFIIMKAGDDTQYWSISSVLGTLIFLFIVYPLRNKIYKNLIK